MYANERKKAILNIVERKNSVSVSNLSREFGVSPVTIRSDLNDLDEKKLLIRTHGGATKINKDISSFSKETEYETRKMKNIAEKKVIANKAANYIHEGDCIILDASSTCYELAKVLLNMPLRITILTNGLRTANLLKESKYFTVIVIGGIVKGNSNAIESTFGIEILDKFSINTFFASSYAISLEDGLSDFSVYESELKKELVKHATSTIALVDSSKFEKKAIVKFGAMEEIPLLITDDGLPNAIKQKYAAQVEII